MHNNEYCILRSSFLIVFQYRAIVLLFLCHGFCIYLFSNHSMIFQSGNAISCYLHTSSWQQMMKCGSLAVISLRSIYLYFSITAVVICRNRSGCKSNSHSIFSNIWEIPNTLIYPYKPFAKFSIVSGVNFSNYTFPILRVEVDQNGSGMRNIFRYTFLIYGNSSPHFFKLGIIHI